ncbi:hypothetical protein [Streptomyces sp. PKU-EA00015]|uniref:hypothetical protein n=1 Tax=Streptomyces sp. PKU-EA00015 TaxID=2748326 RepID=UPI00210AFA82|nr:hypothetical protein [Streptomyces sp. PKU-EA00015]
MADNAREVFDPPCSPTGSRTQASRPGRGSKGAARHKSEPVKKAEAEIAQLREDLAKAREEKRKLTELVGIYAVMIEQLAQERAEAMTERDEALAARDVALGVTALPTTPPQQRAAPAGGRPRRPLPRGTAQPDQQRLQRTPHICPGTVEHGRAPPRQSA